jgi:nucleotide-binding universal stress UspA family protein
MELADDEALSAVHGQYCGMPARPEETGPTAHNGCIVSTRVAVLPWKDAHPLAAIPGAKPSAERNAAPAAVVTGDQPGFRHLFRLYTPFRLLLAIEDDDNGRAAIRLADALNARGAVPRVINAVKLMAPAGESADAMFSLAQAALGEDFHEERARAFRNLITTTTGRAQPWPVRSLTGDPTNIIIADAAPEKTDLLVIGIHRHGRFEQAMGENTATRVMSRSAVPVLGVRPSSSGVPRRIMVATDFGNASREAAHIAANLANPGGTVILVHVTLPYPIVDEGDEGAAVVQREGIEHAFLHLTEEISAGKSIRVETISRTGDAGAELLAAASIIAPELIAMARQRHHLVARMLLGSVSRTVVREGGWPMLITPPARRAKP